MPCVGSRRRALVCRHSQGRAAQVQDDRRQDHPGNRDDDRRRLGHHCIGQWSSIRRKKHSSIVLVRRSHGTRHAQRACGAATQAGRAAAQRHLRSWYDFLNLLFSTFNPSFLRRKGFVPHQARTTTISSSRTHRRRTRTICRSTSPTQCSTPTRTTPRESCRSRCCTAHDGAACSKSQSDSAVRRWPFSSPQYKDPDMGFASWMRFHPQGFTKCVLIFPSLATPVLQLQHVAAPKTVSQLPLVNAIRQVRQDLGQRLGDADGGRAVQGSGRGCRREPQVHRRDRPRAEDPV